MLERISHHVPMFPGTSSAWFICPDERETGDSQSAGSYKSDKFLCHCFGYFLFVSAISAPVSWMDDTGKTSAVTDFFKKPLVFAESCDFFVTAEGAGLSFSAVWICFPIHG